MKRLMLLVAIAVGFSLTADEASANSHQSGFEEVICVLFDTLCSGGSHSTGAGTELALGPEESDLLGELGDGETSGPGGDDFPEFASLPKGDDHTTSALHPTPEPSGALLFAAGLGVVATTIRSRRKG